MNASTLIELFGYLGSALVVVSMLMSSVIKLRVINLIGSVVSGTYALIIGSFPLALMNFCLIAINLYRLIKLLKKENNFDMVETSATEPLVLYFAEKYEQDILKYFPAFRPENITGGSAYVVFCDGTPAGLLLGEKAGSTLTVRLDYSTPVYRDCSVGTYVYAKLPEKGIKTLRVLNGGSPLHNNYLQRMGFTAKGSGFVKEL